MALNDIIVPKENAQGTFDEIALPDATTSARGLLSAADKIKLDGAAKDFTEIELSTSGDPIVATLTNSQLPARVIFFIDATEPEATITLPTPDVRKSGLLVSFKTQRETTSGDTAIFLTVIHQGTHLVSGYELDENQGSMDFRWDGWRWTYTISGVVVVPNATYGTNSVLFTDSSVGNVFIGLPDYSSTLATTQTRQAVTYSTDTTLPAVRNQLLVISNINAAGINVDLPASASVRSGDIYTILGGQSVSGPIIIRRQVLASPSVFAEYARITTTDQCFVFRALGSGSNNWEFLGPHWGRPGAIGSSSRNTGAFTTLNANSTITGQQGSNAGSSSAPALSLGAANTGIYIASGQMVFAQGGVDRMYFDNTSRITIANSGGLDFFTDVPLRLSRGVILQSEIANGILAQRNSTQAMEYRLYATQTSTTNYQRMTIKSVKQTLSALSGASATTTGTFIPDGAVVVGITTRVATAITGATGYTIGDGTDADRWGDITGTAIGTTSDNRDWTAGTIECFTAGGNVTLTAKTSDFTAGAVEICVFYLAGEAD